MNYVDGFVTPVVTAQRETYRRHAELTAGIFKENGALRVVECWGEDVPDGKLTSFPLAVKREAHETVVFSWIVWPSKAVRDAGMRATMEDKRLAGVEMPFDGKRLIYGGFDVLLDV